MPLGHQICSVVACKRRVLARSPDVTRKSVGTMQLPIGPIGKQQWTRSAARFAQMEAIAIRLEAIASRNKKLLGAPGIATRSKEATRGSWPCY